MTPQPTHFSIIPSNVLYHRGLPPSAKLLYAQITGLIGERGFCWASNAFFAERNECSEWTISNLISQLRGEGLLRVEIDKVAGNQRRIYTAETLPLLRKTPRGSLEKSHEGIEKNPNTLLRKTPSRVVKESKSNLVVKVSGENAPAHQNQSDAIQGQSDTSMPSRPAPRPTTFAESIWATATTEAWRAALVIETNIPDLDASWYFSRVKDWSAEKGSTSANWVVTAAKFARDDQRKQQLVTLQPITDHDRHSAIPNPSSSRPGKPGFTLHTSRQDVIDVAERVLAKRRARHGSRVADV